MKLKGLRWYIAGLLMLVTTINYIDRNCLGVIAKPLMEKFAFDKQHYAYILMAFQLCYMIMQPLSGWILDKLGTRRGFSLAVIWWSLADMAHALGRGVLSFGMFRGLLAVGEAANFPGAAKVLSEWFHPGERTVAMGILNAGAGLGAIIAPLVVPWIVLKYGWQMVFISTGALGFGWVILWLLLYRAPETHRWITPGELEHIRRGQATAATSETRSEQGIWKVVLRQRQFWGLAIARFMAEPAWAFFSNWIPLYFIESRGWDLSKIAMFGWIPFVAADLGSLAGGMFSPFFRRLGLPLMTARKAAATLSSCIMPIALLITDAPSPGWAIFYFSIAAFGHQSLSATYLTLPADMFSRRMVATASGLTGSIGYLGSMLFTYYVGWLTMHVGYRPIFTAIGLLDLIGVTFLWILARTPGQAGTDTAGR
jgi:MFS transporter, ACS family, hexuronate transporter